jgi:hypothetical protein
MTFADFIYIHAKWVVDLIKTRFSFGSYKFALLLCAYCKFTQLRSSLTEQLESTGALPFTTIFTWQHTHVLQYTTIFTWQHTHVLQYTTIFTWQHTHVSQYTTIFTWQHTCYNTPSPGNTHTHVLQYTAIFNWQHTRVTMNFWTFHRHLTASRFETDL